MAEFELPLDKGVRRSQDELRLPLGFSLAMENWIYASDDPDRPHKIWGRTAAESTLPSTTSIKEITHAQFDSGADQLVFLANSQLYEADAATAIGAWTSVNDQQGSPAAFSRTGSFLKSITDGRNMSIFWTGVEGERPLIRDLDGGWRYLSMKKTSAPTLSSVLSGAATEQDPDENAVVSGGGWDNAANAYDGDKSATYAAAGLSVAGAKSHEWKFTDNVATSGYSLYIKIASSSLPPLDTGWYPDAGAGGGGVGTEAVVASIKVEVTEDRHVGGGTWTTVFEQATPVVQSTIEYKLEGGGNFANASVPAVSARTTLTYTNGTTQVYAYCYEIWASDGGSTTSITTGTYGYATTEVYRKTLSDGTTVVAESLPSDVLDVVVAGTQYGVVLTPPTRTNLTTDGIADAQISRKIYRTTSTGVWPNLGFIGEVDITATTFTDTFETSGTTLGSPGIYTVVVGSSTIQAAGQAPAFRDAARFRGAILAIPQGDPRAIQWSLPSQPDYWPLPAQSFNPLPSDRNDELKGIAALGDVVLIFARTMVLRIRNLYFANQANFDLGSLRVDIISPNEGLAGGPKAHTELESQLGQALRAWVSDNGIWMTDGALTHERGLGVRKLSVAMDWHRDVDTARLGETELTFDAETQTLYFDYFDPDGNAKTMTFFTAPEHWIQVTEGQAIPKMTGPHASNITSRVIGELSGNLHHWSLSSSDTTIYNERTGTDDAGSDILSFLDTGWKYPEGPQRELHIYEGSLYHSDWGQSESFDLDLLTRRDLTGVIQTAAKRGLRLRGASTTPLGYLNRAGQALRVQLRHAGKTSSLAKPTRALGPFAFETETQGIVEQ